MGDAPRARRGRVGGAPAPPSTRGSPPGLPHHLAATSSAPPFRWAVSRRSAPTYLRPLAQAVPGRRAAHSQSPALSPSKVARPLTLGLVGECIRQERGGGAADQWEGGGGSEGRRAPDPTLPPPLPYPVGGTRRRFITATASVSYSVGGPPRSRRRRLRHHRRGRRRRHSRARPPPLPRTHYRRSYRYRHGYPGARARVQLGLLADDGPRCSPSRSVQASAANLRGAKGCHRRRSAAPGHLPHFLRRVARSRPYPHNSVSPRRRGATLVAAVCRHNSVTDCLPVAPPLSQSPSWSPSPFPQQPPRPRLAARRPSAAAARPSPIPWRSPLFPPAKRAHGRRAQL